MQKLKQFLHWFFIKNHDFFGIKISMDFWMVFSLKMASKSKPFSMKKPSKKQDVFRASQKSFFLRSWSAPGQCPMTVLFFFSVFSIFGRKWSPKGSKMVWYFASFCYPKRSQNASATQPRFFIDLGPVLGAILVICWWFWLIFKLVF